MFQFILPYYSEMHINWSDINVCFHSKVIISKKKIKKIHSVLLRFMEFSLFINAYCCLGFLVCLIFLNFVFKIWRLSRGHLKSKKNLVGVVVFFFLKREFYPILSSWNLISPIENKYFSSNQAILLTLYVIKYTAL